MTEATEPARLAGAVLSRSRHNCAFFHSKEEEYNVLMPCIKDGFERGDRAFHIVDKDHRHDQKNAFQSIIGTREQLSDPMIGADNLPTFVMHCSAA